MTKVVGRQVVRIHGDKIVVSDVELDSCARCGEELIGGQADEDFERRALAAYRMRHDLLTPAEIRALRQRLGLAPRELATLLQLPADQVTVWEREDWIQSPAEDALLRLLEGCPGVATFLRSLARRPRIASPRSRKR